MTRLPDLIIKRLALTTYPAAGDPVGVARKRLHAVLCLIADDDGVVDISEEEAVALAALKGNRDTRRAWADLTGEVLGGLDEEATGSDSRQRLIGDSHPIVLIDRDAQAAVIADYLITAWQVSDDALTRPTDWCDAVLTEAVASGLPRWQADLLADRLADHAASLIEALAPDTVEQHAAEVRDSIAAVRRELLQLERQTANRRQRRERLAEREQSLRNEVADLRSIVASYDDPTQDIREARALAADVIALADRALAVDPQ